jgi:hypothetical protein
MSPWQKRWVSQGFDPSYVLDDMRLAVVADVDTMTPHLYFVHADHLDRPLWMTDRLEARRGARKQVPGQPR